MAEIDKGRLKQALRGWVKKHKVSITDFSEKMDYTYAHAWGILRGKLEFTTETFGRFILAYGLAAGQELMSMAGVPDEIKGPDADAERIPVVYVEAQEPA